jgi:hypothetical protein
MQAKKYLIFLFFIILLCTMQSSVLASTLYRHIPFSASINPGDKIVANYDFQGKTGVDCQANNNHARIDFQYKGHQKSDYLPILLQNSHIPKNESEMLSNTEGQFTLSIDEKKTPANRINIHCTYIS